MSNRSSSRSKSGGEEAFRVTIPADIRPTIQTIRETTGRQHSDEEIYSVLEDCSMDPNETAQKLLYLDTFHEVKKKRDRKKEGQGARGGRGNYYSKHIQSVASTGMNAAPRRENGFIERGSVLRKMKNNAVHNVTKASTVASNGSSSQSNGILSHGHGNELSVDGVIPDRKDNTTIDAKRPETAPLLPTPTFASLIRAHQEKSSLSSNHLPTSAGQASAESNVIKENTDVSSDVDLESSKSEKTASNTLDAIHKKNDESQSEEVEKNQLSEPLQSSSLLAHDTSSAIHSSDDDNQALVESVTISEETSAVTTITVKVNSQVHPESVPSDGQHVTFPSHFKVSEAVKNGLTFGSFDICFGSVAKEFNCTVGEINSMTPAESSSATDEAYGEPSPSSRSLSPATQGETLDHPQSTLFVDNVPSTAGNIPSGTDLKHDELKQEMPLLPEGQEKPPVQSVPNYALGFMFSSAVSQPIQVEGPETQNGVSVAPSSSPAPSVQSSVVAPQPVHLFRHPYAGFLPFGHYLPPYYMPPVHQFLSANGLPQQPSTGNVYLSSVAASAAATAPGVKFPLSQFKPGSNAGNPAHMGIAAGYGSYGSSVGFNHITAAAPGKSTNNEDLTSSQLKDDQIYTTRPLSEGSGVWIPSAGHDLSNMQINPLYNLALQGQHIAFAPAQAGHNAFPGIYQPAQTLAAPSNVNPLLQQSQAMAAAVETMALPSGAYQHSQVAQVNWNPSY
ncbi:GBF-interacting protein 1-like isoform X2 [Mangifera indica]|uniref:GBF-interacting protein 1-like isoform X2 n=1 Tax=Mangifera indica TaxID=29780 RepID=UPI001CF95BFF|nr:GBF-interacting protein 1-like isoform X2 [Mangifera indica]